MIKRKDSGYNIAWRQIKEIVDTEYRISGDILVLLKYKFDYEDEYTYEWELLLFEHERFMWENDWCEGQTDVEVLQCGYVSDIKRIEFYV